MIDLDRCLLHVHGCTIIKIGSYQGEIYFRCSCGAILAHGEIQDPYGTDY